MGPCLTPWVVGKMSAVSPRSGQVSVCHRNVAEVRRGGRVVMAETAPSQPPCHQSVTALHGYRQPLLLDKTNDLYGDMREDAQHCDTSNYSKDHPLYSATNAKVVAKMKDEASGVPLDFSL